VTEAQEMAEIYSSHIHMHSYCNDYDASKMVALLRKQRKAGFDSSKTYLEEMHEKFSKKAHRMMK
jgi:di/tripeptidase